MEEEGPCRLHAHLPRTNPDEHDGSELEDSKDDGAAVVDVGDRGEVGGADDDDGLAPVGLAGMGLELALSVRYDDAYMRD